MEVAVDIDRDQIDLLAIRGEYLMADDHDVQAEDIDMVKQKLLEQLLLG
jgi:hypothetical protein